MKKKTPKTKWRMLRVGEIKRSTDQYNSAFNGWQTTRVPGSKVCYPSMYRRRVKVKTKATK